MAYDPQVVLALTRQLLRDDPHQPASQIARRLRMDRHTLKCSLAHNGADADQLRTLARMRRLDEVARNRALSLNELAYEAGFRSPAALRFFLRTQTDRQTRRTCWRAHPEKIARCTAV